MENIISRILEIDRNAEEKLEAAKLEKAEILKNAHAECKELEKNILKDAEKQIQGIEKINKIKFDKNVSEIESNYSSKQQLMDEFFEKNHQKIENEIFEHILAVVGD